MVYPVGAIQGIYPFFSIVEGDVISRGFNGWIGVRVREAADDF